MIINRHKSHPIGRIWFSADHHFGHKKIIEYENRPFEDIGEMGNEMIERHNSVVGDNDPVFLIGDLTFSGFIIAKKILNSLNGIIYVVPGEHDAHWTRQYSESSVIRSKSNHDVEVLSPIVKLNIKNPDIEEIKPIPVILCHWPLQSWQQSFHGSYHLHGHSHSKNKQFNRRLNVCVENISYTPISLQEVFDKLEDSEVITE